MDAWHPVGTGGTQTAPPYLAALAALARLPGLHRLRSHRAAGLLGAAGRAHRVLRLAAAVESRLLRAWGSVAYAFLPAATGALAGGRLGTAVLAVLLPLMARAAAAASGFTSNGTRLPSWRAAWAYALLLTFTTAFTPVVWPIALLLGAGVLVLRHRQSGTEHSRDTGCGS
ncbi:Integral membrane regulatory protein OS=Streptomyces antimycoticus OX=68175 GN=SANT12839_041110 PE=4 SV=1 [Streptomyces antimycoticus]